MERRAFVEHLIEHYVTRDIFRSVATEKMRRAGLTTSTPFLDRFGNGDLVTIVGVSANAHTVENTRERLFRCKQATLDHIHRLLHDDVILAEHDHVHGDDNIFMTVIEEESEAPLWEEIAHAL